MAASPDAASFTTLSDLVLYACRSFPKPDLILVKRDGCYRPISTAEFEASIRRLSLGLRELGLHPGDKVALLSPNRPEWIMTDLAVLCAGGVTVPIYTSLPAEQIRYIIADSGAKIVVCADDEFARKVDEVRGGLPDLERIIVMDGAPAPEQRNDNPAAASARAQNTNLDAPDSGSRLPTPRKDSAEQGQRAQGMIDAAVGQPDDIELGGWLTLADVTARGERVEAAEPGAFERAAASVRPSDLASIIYTSGTTGSPKGVLLSHGNFVSNLISINATVEFRRTDVALSFLPLSHVLERTSCFMFLSRGSSIAFAESVEAVAANFLEVRPTVMISVPRLFEKIYARIMDQVLAGPALRRAVFFMALKTGKAYAACWMARMRVPLRLALRRALARRLVFEKITARTGGRMRLFVCGGAPLSRDIAEFFLALGLIILPGYGLTETSPVLTGNNLEHYRLGSVGRAVPGVELRIAPDGEILARGPNVMRGYHNREAETREVMAGGWFHTGDIGRLDDDGFLYITDRKKDIIVTSGGKNVAPQPIEILLQMSPYIRSAVVVGSGRKFVSALVVPEFEKLEAWARTAGVPFTDTAALCRRPETAAFLLEEAQRMTPELAPFERVKKIAVLDRDFELESGEMTPTLKVRRANVEQTYADAIDSLYA